MLPYRWRNPADRQMVLFGVTGFEQSPKLGYQVSNLLVAKYQYFYRCAYWQTKNKEDAEDAVQDACVRVATYYNGHLEGEPERRQRYFIRLTVRNAAIDIMTKRGRILIVPLEDIPYELFDPNADPVDITISREGISRIISAPSLSQKARDILILSDFQGMSVAEVAGLMKMKPGAVRTMRCRARGQVRDYLEQEAGEERESEKTRV